MGAAKHDQMVREDKLVIAEEIAVRSGLLTRCDRHCHVYDSLWGDPVDAYKLANYMITNHDELVDIFGGQSRELTDMLRDIRDGYGWSCPVCDAFE